MDNLDAIFTPSFEFGSRFRTSKLFMASPRRTLGKYFQRDGWRAAFGFLL
jgi:hypothetical protein